MIKEEDYWFIEENEDIDSLKCPLCGNKLILPSGCRSYEEYKKDENFCQLIVCVDENNNNLGYHIYCKKEVENV